MPIFIVEVKEVYSQPVLVRAENEEDAIAKVVSGDGEHLHDHLQYSYTLQSDSWTAQLYDDEQGQPDASQKP